MNPRYLPLHAVFSSAYLLLLLILSPAAGAELPGAITRVLAGQGLPPASLSVFIQDVAQDKPFFTFNAAQARNPASAIKVLTTFIALDSLGPAYTWTTTAYADGAIRDQRLRGDLVIKGTGDPFLVSEHYWKFVRGIRDRGLRHITGELVIDNGFFAVEPEDPAAFDGKPLRPYNIAPSALLPNFGTIRFGFYPQPEQNRVHIAADPAPANLQLQNKLKLVPGHCRGRRDIRLRVADQAKGGKITFRGNYPATCGDYELYRVVATPEAMAYGMFKTLWTEMGGVIDGGWRTGVTPANSTPLHTLRSRPLAEIIRGINKYSNNVMTRQLLYTLGAERYGAPGSEVKGKTAIGDWLKAHGLAFPELVLDNGAGLSRTTRISAGSLGRFLLAAYRSPLMPEFVASLPLAAVDGTLQTRFQGTALAGRLHIKTGTLDHVKAMAGYVLGRSGRTFVVVVLVNHAGAHGGSGAAVQNALLEWLFEL